jgi:glutathione synthase/RimK-type ligase-like ATP-grasp enzyme
MGVATAMVVWDDPSVDWSEFDLAVLRSTWDYPPRRHEFLGWAAGVPRLANPFDAVRWSTDKRYLLELATAGLDVVPSWFAAPHERDVLEVALAAAGDAGEGIVVKPAVGAGSIDAARYALGDPDGRARQHAERLMAAGRTVLIQPYLRSVEAGGETAVVLIGGSYSHAVRKGALLDGRAQVDGLFKQETVTPTHAAADERALAVRTLEMAPGAGGDLLYARVDLLVRADGSPVVLECELVEPSLFLDQSPGAAARFAHAVHRLLCTPDGEMVDWRV